MRQLQPDEDEDEDDDNEDEDVLIVSLSFSLWYPGYHGVLLDTIKAEDTFLTGTILRVLRNLLCRGHGGGEDNEVDENEGRFDLRSSEGTSSLCLPDDEDDEPDPFDWMATDSTSRNAPILATGETTRLALESIAVHDSTTTSSSSGLEWMEWKVTYVVIELARRYWTLDPTGTLEGYPIRHDADLQGALQTLLDDAIGDGSLSLELQELVDSSLPLLSVTGNEVETLTKPYDNLMKQYDFTDGARMIRYFGIGIGLITLMGVMALSMAGRRRRFQKEFSTRESKMPPPPPFSLTHEPADLAVPPPEHLPLPRTRATNIVPSLDTEEAVNQMLLLGKHQILMGGTPVSPSPPPDTLPRTNISRR